MADNDRIVSIDEARIASVERRQDRYETITTEALKDIHTTISVVARAIEDIRDEMYRLGRDLISTRETVAALPPAVAIRRKAKK